MDTKLTPENAGQLNQTPELVKDSIKETVSKTVGWFLPAVGMTYACGFLIVFTFFKSYGINTVEFIEAKYIHIGSLFVMACITIILPTSWLLVLWESKDTKELIKILKVMTKAIIQAIRHRRTEKYWKESWREFLKILAPDWPTQKEHGLHAHVAVTGSAVLMLWCFLLLVTFAASDFTQEHPKLIFLIF